MSLVLFLTSGGGPRYVSAAIASQSGLAPVALVRTSLQPAVTIASQSAFTAALILSTHRIAGAIGASLQYQAAATQQAAITPSGQVQGTVSLGASPEARAADLAAASVALMASILAYIPQRSFGAVAGASPGRVPGNVLGGGSRGTVSGATSAPGRSV